MLSTSVERANEKGAEVLQLMQESPAKKPAATKEQRRLVAEQRRLNAVDEDDFVDA